MRARRTSMTSGTVICRRQGSSSRTADCTSSTSKLNCRRDKRTTQHHYSSSVCLQSSGTPVNPTQSLIRNVSHPALGCLALRSSRCGGGTCPKYDVRGLQEELANDGLHLQGPAVAHVEPKPADSLALALTTADLRVSKSTGATFATRTRAARCDRVASSR